MPLHPEHHVSDNSSRTKTTINQSASEHQILANNRTVNGTNQMQSNNLNINSMKSVSSTVEIEHEIDIQILNESLPIAFDFLSSTTKSNINENANAIITTQASFSSPFLTKLMTKFGLNACPLTPPNLIGPLVIDTEYESISNIEQRFQNLLLPGGWYKPKECNPKDRVAIVIPYRDRANHLPVFLKNIHPLLMKQQIEYGIFVIEQIADGLFNRAALMNVGFLEALKLHKWDCFIFHDVDLIPLDDRNLYRCPEQPRHMSVAVDTMGFK